MVVDRGDLRFAAPSDRLASDADASDLRSRASSPAPARRARCACLSSIRAGTSRRPRTKGMPLAGHVRRDVPRERFRQSMGSLGAQDAESARPEYAARSQSRGGRRIDHSLRHLGERLEVSTATQADQALWTRHGVGLDSNSPIERARRRDRFVPKACSTRRVRLGELHACQPRIRTCAHGQCVVTCRVSNDATAVTNFSQKGWASCHIDAYRPSETFEKNSSTNGGIVHETRNRASFRLPLRSCRPQCMSCDPWLAWDRISWSRRPSIVHGHRREAGTAREALRLRLNRASHVLLVLTIRTSRLTFLQL